MSRVQLALNVDDLNEAITFYSAQGYDITMGKAMYGSDTRLPGMKYAVLARPPVVGGKLVSFDATDALKVSGVEKVMEISLNAEEKKMFDNSVSSVAGLIDACKKLEPTLG